MDALERRRRPGADECDGGAALRRVALVRPGIDDHRIDVEVLRVGGDEVRAALTTTEESDDGEEDPHGRSIRASVRAVRGNRRAGA